MRKCWNCGVATDDENSRVCSDAICQRAEMKSQRGDFKHKKTCEYWHSRPKYGKKKRDYMRKYNQRPEVKERRREYARGYYHRPEVKERMLEYARKYNQRPEVKERRREYMREYWQRPEVKERQRERKREQRLNKLREEE